MEKKYIYFENKTQTVFTQKTTRLTFTTTGSQRSWTQWYDFTHHSW